MKAERGGFRMLQHEQRMGSPHEDSYRDAEKIAGPARCPKCRATYVRGRWTWRRAPAVAKLHKCPACRRIEDDFPAGYVRLKGEFFRAHRAEVMAVVKAREAYARMEHPLQRFISVRPLADGVLVTTTDAHLARGVAQAVHAAFQGELDLSFSKSENLLRATWSR
jgi:NMD protein affecting ribosome stability and mRNA decay